MKVKESSSQKSVDSRQTPKTIAEENDTKLSSKKGHKQYITQTSVKKTGQSAPAGSNANLQNHVNNPKLATFAKPGVPVTKLPKIPKLLKTSSLCNVTPSNSNFSVLLKSPNKKEIESESKRETIAKSVHSNKLHEENVSCKSAAVAPEIIKNKNQITFNVTAAKIRKSKLY